MPRKIRLLHIPFGSVGDRVLASNGKTYIIVSVDGAKAVVKQPDKHTGGIGPGRPSYATMVGDASVTFVPESGESEMAGKVSVDSLITVDIL